MLCHHHCRERRKHVEGGADKRSEDGERWARSGRCRGFMEGSVHHTTIILLKCTHMGAAVTSEEGGQGVRRQRGLQFTGSLVVMLREHLP